MDVAELGIRVTYQDVERSTQSLEKLSRTSETAERATKRLSDADLNLTAAQKFLAQQTNDVRAAIDRQMGTTFAMTNTTAQTTLAVQRAATAQTQLGTASKSAGVGITALREPLTSAARSMLGLNPVAAQLSSVLGSFAIGAAPMVGILAGAAALGLAWNKLTEHARKAKEEHERLLNVLRDIAKQEALGAAGDAGAAAVVARGLQAKVLADIERLESQRTRERAAGGRLFHAGGVDRRIADLKRQYDEYERIIQAGERRIQQIEREEEGKRTQAAQAAANARQSAIEAATRAAAAAEAERLRFIESYRREAEALADIAFELERVARAMAQIEGRGIPGVSVTPAGIGRPDVAGVPDFDAMTRARIASVGGIDHVMDLPPDAVKNVRAVADAWFDVGRGVTSAAQAMDLMDAKTAAALHSALSLADGITKLAGSAASAASSFAIAASAASVSFAIYSQLGASASSGSDASKRGGVLGFLQGGTPGAVIGAITSKFGHDRAQKKAQNEFNDAQRSYIDSLGGGGSSFQRELDALNKTFKALEEAARAAKTSVSEEARTAFEAAKQRVEIARINEAANAKLALQLRMMTALGEDATSLQREIEIRDALNAARDDEHVAMLRQIHAAEDLAAAREREASVTDRLLSRLFAATGGQSLAGNPLAGLNPNDPNYAWIERFAKHVESIEAQNKATAAREEYLRREQEHQTQILREQLQVAQESQRAQEQLVNTTRQTFERLRDYSNSLNLSALSPLSPRDRYLEAKRQYDQIAGLAAGGDQVAAGKLPDAANAFLGESRNMFASSTRYADDFRMVQAFLGSMTDKYGTQLTTEERALAELQKHTSLLEKQLGQGAEAATMAEWQRDFDRTKSALDYDLRFGTGQDRARLTRDLQWLTTYGLPLKQLYEMFYPKGNEPRTIAWTQGNGPKGGLPDDPFGGPLDGPTAEESEWRTSSSSASYQSTATVTRAITETGSETNRRLANLEQALSNHTVTMRQLLERSMEN
jgi:hypothetical protein